jgi:hypothetical protein
MIDKVIFMLHAIIFLAGLIIPFVGNQQILALYSLLIPFLFYHWAVNDDTCFLTQVEMYVTDTPKHRTFMGRLIGPIYNVPDDIIGKLIKTVLFALWLFVQFKLGRIPIDIEVLKKRFF